MSKFIYILIVLVTITACTNTTNINDKNNSTSLKIVSLAPSITKELLFLGLEKNIVGATSYCSITKDNDNLLIGSATEVNVEKVLLLKPDIVFATGLTKPQTIKTLKDNGVELYLLPKMKSFDVICNEFLNMGKRVNKDSLALAIVNKAKQKLDSLQHAFPPTANKPKVYMQIGANPLFTVLSGTFMNDYITMAQCENIAHDFTAGTISRETVLVRNPDVIFIVTMGVVGDEEKKKWSQYQEINAIKNGKLFIIDSNIACTPSVLSFVETFDIIIKKIYE